jgi:hypothetical protein
VTRAPQSGLSVEAKLEIFDLYARQCHAIDSGDGPGWAATFTASGIFESPTYQLVATGRAELAEFATASNNAALERGEQLRHWFSAIAVSEASDADAAVQAYLMIIATSSAGSRIDRSLRVEDRLSCEDGNWRFLSRRVFRDDDFGHRS